MTMKVGSSLAAFMLFGKSIAISLSSDESEQGAYGRWEELGAGMGEVTFEYEVGFINSLSDSTTFADEVTMR